MKSNKTTTIIFLFLFINYSFSQMLMSPEGITAENACQPNSIYFLTGLNKEKKAQPIEAIQSIQNQLNKNVAFAKENPNYEGEISIQFAVNCKGEVGGGFHVVKGTGNDEFDDELIEFFKTVDKWSPGMRKKKKPVDSWYMWRLAIKDGHIKIKN